MSESLQRCNRKMDQVTTNSESTVNEFDEENNNGFVFFNHFIPVELISHSFAYYIDAKSLLNCQRVCKGWNTIIKDYVWRQKAKISTRHNFTSDNAFDWKEYYIMHVKFGKNLVKNHSGAHGKERNWNSTGNRHFFCAWSVECPPRNAPRLPAAPEFGSSQHCFSIGSYYGQKMQMIDLLKEGFSANILDNMQPTIKVIKHFYEKSRNIFRIT